MKRLNKTQASKYLKVSRQTVYDLIRKGILVTDENGLITFDDNDSETIRNRCQDTFLPCKDTFTNTETKNQTVTDVVISSRRLKNQYILDLKEEIERLNRTLGYRDKEFEKQDAYIRLLQAYAAFLEDIVKKHRINLQPHLKTFFTEYLPPEDLQHTGDTMQLIRDAFIELDNEFDRARR